MSVSGFKDALAADILNVFLNKMEFADTHVIDGREMPVLIDENELLEREGTKLTGAVATGTYKARRLIYVAKSEFGPRPAHGRLLTLDGWQLRVRDCTEEAGLLAIELEAVKS